MGFLDVRRPVNWHPGLGRKEGAVTVSSSTSLAFFVPAIQAVGVRAPGRTTTIPRSYVQVNLSFGCGQALLPEVPDRANDVAS